MGATQVASPWWMDREDIELLPTACRFCTKSSQPDLLNFPGVKPHESPWLSPCAPSLQNHQIYPESHNKCSCFIWPSLPVPQAISQTTSGKFSLIFSVLPFNWDVLVSFNDFFFKKNFFPLLLPWFLVVLADSFLHSSLKILTFVLLVFLKFFLLKCLKIYPKLSWTQRQRGKLSGKVAKWNSHPMVKQAFVGMLSARSNNGGSLYLLWSISYIEWYMASHDQCITVEGAWTKRLKWLF